MISTSGANLGSGGLFFAPQRGKKRPGYGGGGGAGGDSAGGASGQGGFGSGGRGGWIHVSDSRRPPEFGRIAWLVTKPCAGFLLLPLLTRWKAGRYFRELGS